MHIFLIPSHSGPRSDFVQMSPSVTIHLILQYPLPESKMLPNSFFNLVFSQSNDHSLPYYVFYLFVCLGPLMLLEYKFHECRDLFCLIYSSFYIYCLKKCLSHCRCSVSPCWINEWITHWSSFEHSRRSVQVNMTERPSFTCLSGGRGNLFFSLEYLVVLVYEYLPFALYLSLALRNEPSTSK